MGNLLPRREDFFTPFEQAFNHFWDDFFTDRPLDKVKAAGSFPKLDMYEKDGNLVVQVGAAGMAPADLNVEVDKENYLHITGKYSPEPTEEKGKFYYRKELTQSRFSRTVALPQNIVGEPEAVMKNGILTLTWKLDQPQEQPPKKISIRHEV